MKLLFCFVSLSTVLSLSVAAQFVEVQNDDGSYSIGHTSNSVGNTADSVGAYLTKASGWTGNTGNSRAGVSGDVNVQVPNFLASGVQIATQVPYVEILKLVEAFLRLKGDLASRSYALLNDNAHILAALRDTLISKISTIHNLTLKGIIVLRKVLEFASSLFGNVNIDVGSSGPLFDKRFMYNLGK